MHCTDTRVPFSETGYFSKIVIDYVNESPQLKPFYDHPFSIEGIQAAMEKRKSVQTDRKTLVEALRMQYQLVKASDAVNDNINRLSDIHCFTVTTAHQPNIFTGYLYFFYKILHTVSLAEKLKKTFPEAHFVPVYYMGCEDADLEELGKIFLNGEYIKWDTKQTGAVGRMHTKGLDKIIERIDGELSVLPFGKELTALLKRCYLESPDVQTATFRLVHELFSAYGLIVLIPDSALLKKQMIAVFEDDLFHQTASAKVERTIENLSAHYKVQAKPREINLFYLNNDFRERIVKTGDEWKVLNTTLKFSASELKQELDKHPERFSPNVILRGLFQETLLPNLVFIGGGGELAYWLELKDMFNHYGVPFPVLALRNSFLVIEKKWADKIEKLGFKETDLLRDEKSLADELVRRNTNQTIDLSKEITAAKAFYESVRTLTQDVDVTLAQHVSALQVRAIAQLETLEKKMLRAEKKKFASQLAQLSRIKQVLFPGNNLQERVENFLPYYAKFGNSFIEMLAGSSPAIGKEFIILTEKN